MSATPQAIGIHRLRDAEVGLLAGLAGALAEVLWVGLYAAAGPADAGAVAFGVVVTLFPQAAPAAATIWLGLAIHMALGAALGLLFVAGLRVVPLPRPSSAVVAAALFGAAIWAFNFLILLPRLNPEFVALLPLAVTLASKTLFGLGLGAALAAARRPVEAR